MAGAPRGSWYVRLEKNGALDRHQISVLINLRPFQLISLESTTYPGCTRDLIAKKLNNKFNLGKNFFLSYSPEREDPGNKKNSLKNIPKIVSGYSKNCLYLSSLIYSMAFKKIYKVKSLEHAEFTKIYENIFRAVNISLVNEMKVLANKIKVNFNDIVDAASTKPFGFMPFYPGPGIGGHCIPIDPLYLSWLAKKHKIETQLIKYSFVINSNTTKNIIKKISKFILDNKIKDPNVLIIGVTYKKNIDDVRESPSLKIMKSFLSKKIKFSYHDPYVSELPTNRNFNFKISSVPLTKVEIKKFKICLICTDHDNIDYNKIYRYSNIIFDSRNVFDYDDDKIIQV